MRPNIGLINALIRITCGFTLLAFVTAKMVKKPNRLSLHLLAVTAGMKIAEGFTRFCPLTYLYEENFSYYYEDDDEYYEDEDEEYPVNPS